jgi:ferredoxin-type protein NapH
MISPAIAGQSTTVAGEVSRRGWVSVRWLLLRRMSQLLILALFLLGPLAGLWIVKGNLSSSLTLETLPLTDPLLILQSLATGHRPAEAMWIGAGLVLLFYLLVGGRVFCGWVCPVNMVTDAAHWLRRRWRLPPGKSPRPSLRYWLLGGVLAVSAMTGTIAWEFVNPVSMLHRGLLFGVGLAWTVVLAVFLFDLLVAERGWCGHVCPMGALYGLIGHSAILRVSAANRGACNDCADCYAVCPEPQIIKPALKGGADRTPLILSGACSNCGRCMDVCSKKVFRFTHRFDHRSDQ